MYHWINDYQQLRFSTVFCPTSGENDGSIKSKVFRSGWRTHPLDLLHRCDACTQCYFCNVSIHSTDLSTRNTAMPPCLYPTTNVLPLQCHDKDCGDLTMGSSSTQDTLDEVDFVRDNDMFAFSERVNSRTTLRLAKFQSSTVEHVS